MTITIDMNQGVKEEASRHLGSVLTIISQRNYSDEVMAAEGKRPSRERIERLYGRCLIDAESEGV